MIKFRNKLRNHALSFSINSPFHYSANFFQDFFFFCLLVGTSAVVHFSGDRLTQNMLSVFCCSNFKSGLGIIVVWRFGLSDPSVRISREKADKPMNLRVKFWPTKLAFLIWRDVQTLFSIAEYYLENGSKMADSKLVRFCSAVWFWNLTL